MAGALVLSTGLLKNVYESKQKGVFEQHEGVQVCKVAVIMRGQHRSLRQRQLLKRNRSRFRQMGASFYAQVVDYTKN